MVGTSVIENKLGFKEKVQVFELALSQLPNAVAGRDSEKLCPLKHTFVEGSYIREIFMPKGTILTSKIHKICHPYFIMKGEVSVVTEEGTVKIKAPFQGITKPGTKRAIYVHEDCVWITVHSTNETDLDKIEDQIIAKNFDELPNSIKKEQII